MVTVKAYHLRQGADGKPYVSLELSGNVELVQSQRTGRFYATIRKCFIYSTLDETAAKLCVGQQMKGNIVRIPCDPYEYKVPETGEVIILTHQYSYNPEEVLKTASVPTSFVPAG